MPCEEENCSNEGEYYILDKHVCTEHYLLSKLTCEKCGKDIDLFKKNGAGLCHECYDWLLSFYD